MEHRWWQRRRVHLPVLLQLGNGDVVFGIAQDISRDGIYIRMRTQLKQGSSVKVVIVESRNEGIDDSIALPAIIVHRTDDGTGLMFSDVDIPTAAMLRRGQDSQRSREKAASA